MSSENEFVDDYDQDDEQFTSTRLLDNGQHDGMLSDESQYSDDLRFSSYAIRNSCVSNDISHTSSTLRQEAIALTKVRCKQRKNWIQSSASVENNHRANFIQSFSSNDQVDGTNTNSTGLNTNVNLTTRAKSTATMLVHKNSNKCNKNENKNGETPAYELLQLNPDHRSIKNDTSKVSPLLKTVTTYDKDASSTTKKPNGFYLIHHQSSLIPIQDLLNKNINTNIEIIQMDEQECILEIVDGVLTLVPKDKSISSATNTYEEKFEQQRTSPIHYQTNNYDSPDQEDGSSSISSSISTPPISENEEERHQGRNRNHVQNLEPEQEDDQEEEMEEELKEEDEGEEVEEDEQEDEQRDDQEDDQEDEQADDQEDQQEEGAEEEEEEYVDEDEQERELEQDEITSSSRLSLNKEETQGPFILLHDIPSKSPPLPSQSEQSVDLLDLFSTPLVPLSNSNTTNNDKKPKNLLDDSLSSASSYEHNNNNDNNDSSADSIEEIKVRSSSPIQNQSKSSSPSSPIKEEIPPLLSTPNPTPVLTTLVQTFEKPSINDQTEVDYQLPKPEPPPVAKPLNKARISEFASLLSSSVHLLPPPSIKNQEPSKSITTINKPPTSPLRSEDQSFSSIPSANSDREERESYHTVKSNNNSEQEQEQIKKHIDARYNEKIDDRTSIQINTSNIKALFEQKISDTNKALTQSTEHLLQLNETRQQHKKVPISYGSLKRSVPSNSPPTTQNTNRRQSNEDISTMNKYKDHIAGTKEIVIEDKQPEYTHKTQSYIGNARRNNTEQIIRPGVESLTSSSPVNSPNDYFSESLIAREIRQTQEKEEELRRQRQKCGLSEDLSSLITMPNNDTAHSGSSTPTKQPAKSSSFLSNLDFFTSKANPALRESASPRRSTITIHNVQNVVYDSQSSSPYIEDRQPFGNVVSQELSRFNNSGVPIVRTSSTNNLLHRSSSNQSLNSTVNTNNIIQREIEAIRAKESELRQLGRIQNTSDDHSDPKKYQECVSTIPKSQSANTFSIGKVRRESGRTNGPMIATSNGIYKTQSTNNNSSGSTVRGKFPNPSPTAPIVSSSSKSIDYSKLSSAERLALEKREFQEREAELRKQRNLLNGATVSEDSTDNNGLGDVLQNEQDDDREGYFDKIERFKRMENEKTQTPLIRPAKKLDMLQRWEQMIANNNGQIQLVIIKIKLK